MRAVLGCTLMVALATAAGPAAGEDKDTPIDGKKLVGAWEPKDLKKDGNAVIEFAKDGKLTITSSEGGKVQKVEGSYKLSGNKLNVAVRIKDMDVREDLTVLRLTDDELVTEDAKGKKDNMKRVKGR